MPKYRITKSIGHRVNDKGEDVYSFKEGDVKEFDKIPLALQAHVVPVSDDAASHASADVDAIKEEAEAEAREHLAEIHELVVGKAPHHKSGLDKIKDDIIEALTKSDEE